MPSWPGVSQLTRMGPLLWLLVRREITERYLGSMAGAVWGLFHPILLLATYAFVFTHIIPARIPDAEFGFVPYLALAFWPWLAFAESLQRGATAITDHAALIDKVPVPMTTLVLSRVLATFAIHSAGYTLVLAILTISGTSLSGWGVVWVPLYLLLLAVFSFGLTLMAAAFQVFVRDLAQILAALLTVWFFCTPIIYSPALIPAQYHGLFAFNPMTWFAEMPRRLMLYDMVDWSVDDLIAIGLTLAVAAVGYALFRRCRPYFEEFL